MIEKESELNKEVRELKEKFGREKEEAAKVGGKFEAENRAKELAGEYIVQVPQARRGAEEDEIQKAVSRLEAEPDSRQIDEILKVYREKGLPSAVKLARGFKNPHLLDHFHDIVALEILEKEDKR